MDDTIRHIGELTGKAVFIYDLKGGKFRYRNENFADIFEIRNKDMDEQPGRLISLIKSEDRDYLRHTYDELLEKNGITDTEFRIHFPDNIIKHLSLDAYMLDGGTLVAGFIKNCTQEKQHEDYIINYGAKKDTLLDMITHNLKGPLNLSKNILAWLKQNKEKQEPEKMQAHLILVESSTQECLDIINDFLREEHMESEKIFVRKTRFDVIKRVIETLDKLVATNKNKQFRILTELESLNINTDSVKFFQIIHNLVSNAIKFTADNGKIDVILEETADTIIIRVRDNGIGIPPEFCSRLFERNTPAGRRGLKEEASDGMGLHIVKVLVELLDGKIWVESKVDAGTTFFVELPKE